MPDKPDDPPQNQPGLQANGDEKDSLLLREAVVRLIDLLPYPAYALDPLPRLDSDDLVVTHFNIDLVKLLRKSPEQIRDSSMISMLHFFRERSLPELREETHRQQTRRLELGKRGNLPFVRGSVIVDNRKLPQGDQYDGIVYIQIIGSQLRRDLTHSEHLASIVQLIPTPVKSPNHLLDLLHAHREKEYIDILRNVDEYRSLIQVREGHMLEQKQDLNQPGREPVDLSGSATANPDASRATSPVAIRFESIPEMDRAIDLFDSDLLRRASYDLFEHDTLLVPPWSIQVLQERGIRFKQVATY